MYQYVVLDCNMAYRSVHVYLHVYGPVLYTCTSGAGIVDCSTQSLCLSRDVDCNTMEYRYGIPAPTGSVRQRDNPVEPCPLHGEVGEVLCHMPIDAWNPAQHVNVCVPVPLHVYPYQVACYYIQYQYCNSMLPVMGRTNGGHTGDIPRGMVG